MFGRRSHDGLSAQAPVHETPLLERHPPLAGLTRAIRVELLHESQGEFLPRLGEVTTEIYYEEEIYLEQVSCTKSGHTHQHLHDSLVVRSER